MDSRRKSCARLRACWNTGAARDDRRQQWLPARVAHHVAAVDAETVLAEAEDHEETDSIGAEHRLEGVRALDVSAVQDHHIRVQRGKTPYGVMHISKCRHDLNLRTLGQDISQPLAEQRCIRYNQYAQDVSTLSAGRSGRCRPAGRPQHAINGGRIQAVLMPQSICCHANLPARIVPIIQEQYLPAR